MTTTRRVFLEVVGVGAAACSLDFGCIAIVEDARALDQQGKDVGATGTGGAGTGGVQPGAPGTGGATSGGTGGAPGEVTGSGGASPGTGGRVGSGGAQADAGAGGAPTDARPATGNDGGARDATTPVLMAGDILAGNVSSLAVGALNALQGRAIAIGRDASGVYALTLVCTHQGCTAAPAGNTGARLINCPCHGSQFDSVGNVRRGPAARPLVHFGVTVDAAGGIIVHSNMQVGATVRTAG
jgi:cytochrome b6-f complex iron-sulfur subunit